MHPAVGGEDSAGGDKAQGLAAAAGHGAAGFRDYQRARRVVPGVQPTLNIRVRTSAGDVDGCTAALERAILAR